MEAEFSVVDSVKETFGKYPSAFGNVVYLEKKAIENMIRKNYEQNPTLKQAIDAQYPGFNITEYRLNDYAFFVSAVASNRMYQYLDYVGTDLGPIVWSDAIGNIVKENNQLSYQSPLNMALSASLYIQFLIREVSN